MRAFAGLCLIGLLVYRPTYAQDLLYLQKSTEKGKITEITATFITYQKKSSSYLIPIGKTLFVVNAKGDFLVPSKLHMDNPYDQAHIRHFIAADTAYAQGDRLYTSPDSLFQGKIVKEDRTFVYLADNSKIDKRSLMAVIYANGTLQLFASPDKVADVFAYFQRPLPPSVGAPPITVPPSAATAPATISATSTNPPPAASPQTVASPLPTPKDTAAQPPRDTIAQLFSSLAPNLSEDEFAQKATKKTKQFTDYLSILCTKSAPESDKDKAVDQAITLFINEDAKVEVQSLNTEASPRFKIRQYLTRLRFVQYDKIEVEWTNVQYVSHLLKGDDGKYYGIVTFEQKFSGYKDGKLVYKDITKKSAKVILQTYEKSYEGTTQTLWDVLLGDVSVRAIKSF